jgi:hypothetical protein
MPQTPPRLASADPGTQPGYAPISWTAVASLVIAVLFAVLLTGMLVTAFRGGRLLIEAWLLFFPALAIILAFVARRQIRASEGTRVGERYANAAWWVAMVAGLGYVAYLFAIDFAIRRDAREQFITWSNYLKDLNPADPKDRNFFLAAHMTLDPGVRGSVPAGDPEKLEATFREPVLAFRGSDVVRLCLRNRGAVEFRPEGLRTWEQRPTEITCTLTATLVSPEGEHGLVVPMRAVIDEKTKQRRWQIAVAPGGYIDARQQRLTPYGWAIERLEASGRNLAQELMARLARGDTSAAYLMFIHPEVRDPQQAADLLDRIEATTVPRGAVVGGPTVIVPHPPGAGEYLTQKVLSKPGGGPHDPAAAARFASLWNTPNKILPAGSTARNNPDTNSTLFIGPEAIEYRVPIEIQLGSMGPMASAARGAIVLRATAEADPKLFADLSAARQAAASAGLSDTPAPPPELANPRIPWRLVRVESDLQPMPSAMREASGMPMPGHP